MPSRVSLARCQDYQQEHLDESLNKLVEHLGGWRQFIAPGESVLIKPNFIAPRPPEVPAQTDGRLILAIARQLSQITDKILVGDSTAWGSAKNNAALVGLNETALASVGLELVNFNHPCRVTIQTPAGPRRVSLDRTVLEADKIINVPKLKAHQQLILSGALKNAFGAVVGKRKSWWHFRYGGKSANFAQMIVGVHQAIRPVLNIIDAVVVMQGQGPINGQPRNLGLLLASTDAAAVDSVSAELLAASSEKLQMLAAARRTKAGVTDLADIELLGESLDTLRIDDFLFAEQTPLRFGLLRVCKSIARQLRILIHERRENTR